MKQILFGLLFLSSLAMAQEPVITKVVNDSGVVVTIHDYSQPYTVAK